MAGRPKGSTNSPKKEEIVREVLAEKMFSDGGLTQVFVKISAPFTFKLEGGGAELRIEIMFINVGSSGRERFEVPVSALPFIQQSFTSVISRDKNRFLAECDRSSQAVSLCLCVFSHRGKNRWNEIMTAALPVNVMSKDPEQQDPCSWLDRVFGELMKEVVNTVVIPPASLDEVNATVQAAT